MLPMGRRERQLAQRPGLYRPGDTGSWLVLTSLRSGGRSEADVYGVSGFQWHHGDRYILPSLLWYWGWRGSCFLLSLEACPPSFVDWAWGLDVLRASWSVWDRLLGIFQIRGKTTNPCKGLQKVYKGVWEHESQMKLQDSRSLFLAKKMFKRKKACML
jgi:hypothetical protein